MKVVTLLLALSIGGPQSAQVDQPDATRPEIRKSFLTPAVEIVLLDSVINAFGRRAYEDGSFDVTPASIRRNLHTPWVVDDDPFQVNQVLHPYQGAMYHSAARSAGLNYWQSAAYTFAGSAMWEIAGETTPPSINDQVASGIGGTFLGEALFRMSSLILEHGGGMPRAWRELAAAVVSPATGFNRLVFSDRYGAVFSSKDAAYYSRLGIGYTHSVREEVGVTTTKFQPNEAQVDFTIDYGLPGLKNYEYTRPFDY